MAETSPTTPIRVRMAPSPTGPLHVGGARTALFNWLFARKYGGKFVLRIEDTDKERSEERYIQEIVDGLDWLGIDWDEGPLPDGNRLPVANEKGDYGPYHQSARTAIYKKYLEQLIAKGDAYYCYCTKDELEAQRAAQLALGIPPKYNGHCRSFTTPPEGREPQVIRFKMPETRVSFKDIVRGEVSFDSSLFGDIAIAKDLDSSLYNFAVVVDDELMKITHVIRGEDHLSNTPKQILFARALGFKEPTFAHIPLILNSDRSKMSKRFSDVALSQYREKGYLPEALLNFLALLGWHPKDDREVLSAHDLISEFELERVQQAGAVFNEEKLNWLNREHMKKLSNAELAALLVPFLKKEDLPADLPFAEKFVAAERDRASTLRDFIEQGRFFFKMPEFEADLLVGKDSTREDAAKALHEVGTEIAKIDAANFAPETLRGVLAYTIGERRRGVVLWPLRVAVSGLKASPDPVDIMHVLGKEESLRRIREAQKKLAP